MMIMGGDPANSNILHSVFIYTPENSRVSHYTQGVSDSQSFYPSALPSGLDKLKEHHGRE